MPPPSLMKHAQVGDVGIPEGGATIPLRQGHNVWRLLRTDRDGASQAEVVDTVGPAIQKMVRPVGMTEGPWEIFRTSADPPEWRIGDVRPVRLRELVRGTGGPELGPSLGPGELLAERVGYPGDTLPTVRAQRPWWVLVDLWWRRPDVELYWPGFRVNWLGNRTRTVVDADWVLDSAKWIPPEEDETPDPGDETSAEAHGERVGKATANALRIAVPPIVGIGATALLGYALVKTGALKRLFGGKR